MPAVSRAERVKPCLLDRITDDPGSPNEKRAYRAVSPQRYLKGVLRDLRWLFNTGAHPAYTQLTEVKSWTAEPVRQRRSGDGDPAAPNGTCLGDFPEAYSSVLAFGIPDLSGLISSSLNLKELEEELAAAIKLFEPRIDPKTLRVRAVLEKSAEAALQEPSVISFEIDGMLWMEPVPEHLRIKTLIDLETGQCSVRSHADG